MICEGEEGTRTCQEGPDCFHLFGAEPTWHAGKLVPAPVSGAKGVVSCVTGIATSRACVLLRMISFKTVITHECDLNRLKDLGAKGVGHLSGVGL